ncbi:MAG: ribosome small subunit-dependent GTPase A [Myxococcota bacterium]|nr:ribosome small subunit-dependent GTPase A [Myxococcota bacterium]
MQNDAVVIGHFGLDIEVSLEDGEHRRIRARRSSEPVVVGDRGRLSGRGVEVLARETVLARRDARNRTRAIAANLDVLAVTIAGRPAAPRGYVDRVIVAARAAHIEPFLVVNKCDQEDSAALSEQMHDLFAASDSTVPVFAVSAHTGAGIDGIRSHLSGRRGAFVGTSGVGKSSLLNALVPGLDLEVGEINRLTRLGRHVTTRSSLHVLPGGGELIDTPGFRDFVPVDLSPADLAAHFPCFEDALQRGCRFRDCLHRDEPDCGVTEAVAGGEVDASRHEIYLGLLADLERVAERQARGARS